MIVLDNNQKLNQFDATLTWEEHQVGAILHEIHQALRILQSQLKPTTIDLQAIPFAPGEEAKFVKILGRGEVTMTIDALGESTITETGFSGVWLVEHKNEQDERIAFQLEIAEIPALALTPKSEIAVSERRLANQLETHE